MHDSINFQNYNCKISIRSKIIITCQQQNKGKEKNETNNLQEENKIK